jgi:hypothetical protein
MASIENLEIVVDVDISSALAALDELQSELRDLADTINDVDARGTEGIDINTTLDDLDGELAALETELETFEQTAEVEIPVEYDVQNLDRVTNTLRNLQSTTARPSIDFDVSTDALDDAETRLSSMASDLGLEGMEDGELSVRNMKVAAARVTVIGDGEGGASEALNDVLRSFSVDVGGEDTRDIQVDERDLSGVKKPLTGPGFLTMSSPTAADDDELREGMGMLFGDDEEDMFPDIGQQLAEASANARTTSAEAIPPDVRDRLDELGVSTRDVTDAMQGRASFLGREPTEGTAFDNIFDDLDRPTSRANRIMEETGTLGGDEIRDLGFDDFGDLDESLQRQMDFDPGEALRDADFDLEAEMEMIPDDATAGDIGTHLADRLGGRRGQFGRMDLDFGSARDEFMPDLPSFDLDRDGGRSRIGRLMGGAADELGDMRESMSNFDLRMSDLHNAMARLIPLLFIFIGALPAAITALVGLAAAAISAAAGLAALTGLGAMGLALEDGQFNMDNLREAAEDIKSDFIEAFAPLAERLQPLFEDGLDALGRFFEEIAGEGDALIALTDEARAFGGFLMDFVPMLLNAMASLADALAPMLANIGEWMRENLHNVMRTLVDLTAKAMPVVASLGQQIAAMIPALVKMSIGFAQVADIILSLVGIVGQFLSLFGFTPRLIGLATAAALAFASAILLARTSIISLIIDGIVALASSIYGFLFPAIFSGIGAMFGFSTATFIASAALASFITLATLGAGLALVAAAGSAAASFLGLADSIGQATDNLKEYNRVSGRTDDDGPNPYNQGVRGANLGGGGSRGGNVTVIESNGDNEQARSDGAYAAWRQGRTTGDSP